nr:unnamed protein product [Callosobruchus analis]
MLASILIITFMFGGRSALPLSKDGPMMPLVVNGSNIYYYGFIYKGTALQAEAFCRNHNMDLLSIETP